MISTQEMRRVAEQVTRESAQQGKHENQREGICPTCAQQTTFTFLGEQRWPAKVAQAAGLPELIHLWTCDTCQTTLTEPAQQC